MVVVVIIVGVFVVTVVLALPLLISLLKAARSVASIIPSLFTSASV